MYKNNICPVHLLLAPYAIPFHKVRYGDVGAGGYVIFSEPGKLPLIESIYSLGIGDNISFEADFVNKCQGLNYRDFGVFIYEDSIDQPPPRFNEKFMHWKKVLTDAPRLLIGIFENNQIKKRNMLLKVCITAGREYSLFQKLPLVFFGRFQQIIVEFHKPALAPHAIFEKINANFYLGHVHGNNTAGSTDEIPDILECTYIRRDLVPGDALIDCSKYPKTKVDFRSSLLLPELPVSYWKDF